MLSNILLVLRGAEFISGQSDVKILENGHDLLNLLQMITDTCPKLCSKSRLVLLSSHL